jgi:hypothetical protein
VVTKRDALVIVLAGTLATAGIGRYEEHKARAERLVDEALSEHAHELAELQRANTKREARAYPYDLEPR